MKPSLIVPFAVSCLFSCLFVLAGCKAQYDHTEITAVGGGQLQQAISGSVASMSVGDVLTATITPYNTDDNKMIETVQSADPTIVNVLDTQKEDEFAFIGVAAGNTQIVLRADDQVVDVIKIEVVDQ